MSEPEQEIFDQHPGLLDHRDDLASRIGILLGETRSAKNERLAISIADTALEYVLDELLATENILGATEVAPLLGVTRQRVQQIAHTSKLPQPIAWVANARPVWLRGDVIKAREERSQ